MSQAPPTGNPFADIALQIGSKLFLDKMLNKGQQTQFRSRKIRTGRRMQDYIPELQQYARGRQRF